MPLDEIDLHILAELERDSSRTNVRLARVVGLSPPACLRRVRRLRQSGAIRGEMAVLDPSVAGIRVTLVVGVVLDSERRDVVAAFKERMRREPSVAQCWYVTGSFDFVLVVRVADIAAYEALSQRLFHADPNVKRFESLVSLDDVKQRLGVLPPALGEEPKKSRTA